MPRGFSGNLIFAIIARMLCGNHLNFFVLLRVAFNISITGPGYLIGVKKQRKFCRCVTCSQWKGEFWLQEVIRARLDTRLRLSTIDEVVSRRCKLRNRKTGE